MAGKYRFEVTSLNENTSHGLVLSQIPQGAEVLECGCASGYLTKYMKEKLDAKVSIIEISEEDYQEAQQYAVDGYCGSLEDNGWYSHFSEKRFDYILFPDVLEHLRTPEVVLKKATTLLKDDGTVIVSLPNIGHNDVLINLFHNRWNYTPLGLLDETHVHFWGRENISDLVEQAGLAVTVFDYAILSTFRTEQRIQDDNIGCLAAIDAICNRPYGDVYQFIVTAQKQAYTKDHNILPVDRYYERKSSYSVLPLAIAEYEREQAQQAESLRVMQSSLSELTKAHSDLQASNSELLSSFRTLQEFSRTEEHALAELKEFCAARERDIVSLKGSCEELQNKVFAFENELSISRKDNESLKCQIEQEKNECRQSIATKEKEYREHLSFKETEYRQSIAFKEAEYQLQLSEKNQELGLVYSSKAWKLICFYRKRKDIVLALLKRIILFAKREKHKNRVSGNRNLEIIPTKRNSIHMVQEDNAKPLVSVIMPCYNDGKYLSDAVESVLAQTYDRIELIIIDDGSDDEETLRLEKSFSSKPSIRVIPGAHSGPAFARNLGIKNAGGKYILPLDSDDIIDSNYIAEAVEIMESDPHIGIVYCKADFFGEKTGPWELPDYSIKEMLAGNIIFVTSLFRKSDWDSIGGFRTEMKHGLEDWDFWLSIIEKGSSVVRIPKTYFHYRIKRKSRTNLFQNNLGNMLETFNSIYENHKDFFWENIDEYILRLRQNMVGLQFLNGKLTDEISLYKQTFGKSKTERIKDLLRNPVSIMTPPQTVFVGQMIQRALSKNGIESFVFTNITGIQDNTLHIVLCPQYFELLPHEYIAFQMEQTVSSRWLTPQYYEILRNAIAVFDYSKYNIQFFKKDEVINNKIHYLPMDYICSYSEEKYESEYDVLFYGDTNNEHRKTMLDAISESFDVTTVCGLYGEKMAKMIQKAKIVVNIHYYENALLETPRIYEVLSYNSSIVISESSTDKEEDSRLDGIVDFVPVNDIVAMKERIEFWLSNENLRQKKLSENKEILESRGSIFEKNLSFFLDLSENATELTSEQFTV